MAADSPVMFREVQRFRQRWLWFILLAIAGVYTYGVVQQVILGKPWGTTPAPNVVLIIFWVVTLAVVALVYWMGLSTEVRGDGLWVQFLPFHWSFHRISLEGLKSCEARTYKPIREYGGWGIRHVFWRKSKAYNVSGNRGVQLEFQDGRRLLIGSQRADELARAIASLVEKPRTQD